MSDKYILLVEDNPDDAALTLRAFRKSNVQNEIILAKDGVEALDFLFGRVPPITDDFLSMPEVVLLDLKLPRLDGLEVLERLRADERTRLLPVVMLTTSQEQNDLLRSYDLGANSYIRKPVDFSKFMEVIRSIGQYWLDLNLSAHRR